MKRGSNVSQVFSELCESVLDVHDEVMHVFRRPSNAMRMDLYEYRQMSAGIDLAQQKRAERELFRQNIVEIQKTGNKVKCLFSDDGKVELLKYAIIHSDRFLPRKQVCLISFDIPEVAAEVRRMFRGFLKEAGFNQLHRSVWISQKDIAKMFQVLVKKLGLSSWISVFIATRS